MTDSAHDPKRLERLVSRRAFLSTSGAAAGLLLGAAPALATPTHRRPRHHHQPRSIGAGSIYHPPYTLEASCALSEDHFLVRNAKIDPASDTVSAYSRADRQAEALVLQGGTISQVYRDPTASGGWNRREVAAGATEMVAGMASDANKQLSLHLFYRTTANTVKHLIEQPPGPDGISSGQFTLAETLEWNVPGRLQVTTDVMRNLLVFSFEPSSARGRADAQLRFYWTTKGAKNVAPFTGTLTNFEFDRVDESSAGSASIMAVPVEAGSLWVMVPDPSGGSVSVHTFALVGSGGTVNGDLEAFSHQPPSYAPVSIHAVDYMTVNKWGLEPTAIVRSARQDLYALSYDPSVGSSWNWLQLQLPAHDQTQPLVWEPSNIALSSDWSTSSNLVNLFTVIDGTLSVVRQVDQNDAVQDATQPVFDPAVPLQTDVGLIASQARPSALDELIVAGSDGALQMLTKAIDGSWSAIELHLPDTEPAQLSTYRVQLTLSDDWSVGVVGESLQVTPSAPVMALIDGRGVFLSEQAPLTVTTGAGGQVTIPFVADGLWAPELTVSSSSLVGSVTVRPSHPLNDYMAGTAGLNTLPAMSDTALANASTPAGTPVYPLARRDGEAAQQAASMLAAAARAAANPTVGELTAPRRHRHHDHHHHAHHHRHHHSVRLGSGHPRAGGTRRVGGVQVSFDHLIDDALYAIKRGAAKVETVVINWDSTVKRWVVDIAAVFEAWGEQGIKVVIETLQDAAHVFHSVINHLEAALDDVIDWLKVHVLALLRDTITLGRRYDGWLLQLADGLEDLVGKAKGHTDDFFKNRKADVHTALTDLEGHFKNTKISDLPHSRSQPTAEADPSPPSTSTVDARWLHNTLVQDGPAPSGSLPVADELKARFDQVVNQLEANHDLRDDFIGAANAFRSALAAMVTNPKDFGSAGVDQLLAAVADAIDAALDLVNVIADVLLDLILVAISALRSVLAAQLNQLPLLGPLLKAAGMTDPPTIGSMLALVVAFPTVLGYKLVHGADALPFQDAPTTRALRATDSTADDLSYCTAGATLVWADFDTLACTFVADGKDPPDLFTWADIVAPTIISALTVPAHDGGLPFTSPIRLDDVADIYAAVAWSLAAVPGLLTAVGYAITQRYGDTVGEAAGQTVLCLTSMDGALAAVFGVVAAVAQGGADVPMRAILGVLGNVSPALAWGLEKGVVAGSDGLSAVLVGVLGMVCSDTAALLAALGPE